MYPDAYTVGSREGTYSPSNSPKVKIRSCFFLDEKLYFSLPSIGCSRGSNKPLCRIIEGHIDKKKPIQADTGMATITVTHKVFSNNQLPPTSVMPLSTIDQG